MTHIARVANARCTPGTAGDASHLCAQTQELPCQGNHAEDDVGASVVHKHQHTLERG